MLPYYHDFTKNSHMRHAQLTHHQGTHIAILPIHMSEERAVFRVIVKWPNSEFAKLGKPNWITVARQWMNYGDGHKVFYKASQQSTHIRGGLTVLPVTGTSEELFQGMV